MITRDVTVDECTFEALTAMAVAEGSKDEDVASRLFSQAIQDLQPKQADNTQTLAFYGPEDDLEDRVECCC